MESDIEDPSSSPPPTYRFNLKLWRVEELDPGTPSKAELERAERNTKIIAMFKRNLDFWEEQNRLEAERKAQAVSIAGNGRKWRSSVLEKLGMDTTPTVDKKEEQETNTSSSSLGILGIPAEIMESICILLDGRSVLNLKETCDQIGQVVDQALSCRKGWKFWRSRCSDELSEKSVMRALVSFHTLVGFHRRLYYSVHIDSLPKNPKIYTWEDVYRLVSTTQHKLETFPISMKILYRVQETLKNDVRLGFKNNIRFGYPVVNITTYGSLLIYDHVPCTYLLDMNHGYVFEDMEAQRREYKILRKGERVIYTKFMDLPVEKTSEDVFLPKPVTIMIIATVLRLCLFNTRDGVRHCIKLPYPLPYALSERMATLIATQGEYLGFWLHPDRYRLYRISVDPDTGTPNSVLLQDFCLQGVMEQYWFYVRRHSAEEYVPLFETQSPRLVANYPIYSLVSPKFYSFTFLPGPTDTRGRTTAIAVIESPIFPTGAGIDPARLQLIGHAHGFGIVLFFSREKLFALCDDVRKRFIHRDWPDYKFNFEKTQEKVKKVQIISESLILILTEDSILLSTIEVIPPIEFYRQTSILDFGHIEMKMLRRIELRVYTISIPSPMEVKHFHFDFDKGTPYIFMFLDEPGTTSPHTYQLMKLEFRDQNSEKEPEKVTERICKSYLKGPPRPRRLPRKPIHPLNKQVLAEVKDPRTIALLEAFGVTNNSVN